MGPCLAFSSDPFYLNCWNKRKYENINDAGMVTCRCENNARHDMFPVGLIAQYW